MKIDHSNELPDKALSVCWEILDRLEVGNNIVISDFAPQKPDLFIECAKKYADYYRNILFSNDFKQIRKIYSFAQQVEIFQKNEE